MPPKPKPTAKPKTQTKSEATRARILDAALVLFRKHGLGGTTMRDVAEAADMALGAAYYYFPSKEAILLAYYARNQLDHEERARRALAAARGLRDKLGVVMHAKLESIRRERKLLAAIVQRLADPSDAISAFAAETRAVRAQSMELFARALDDEPLSDELKRLAVPALWMLHVGFMLYFVHDRSRAQEKTAHLVDDTLDLIVPLIYLGAQPMVAALVAQLGKTLANAGLV